MWYNENNEKNEVRKNGRIPNKQSQHIRHQIPHNLGDKVPIQGAGGENLGAAAGADTARMHGEANDDTRRKHRARSRAPADIVPARHIAEPGGAVHQGAVVEDDPRGIPGAEAKILGSAPVGAWVLLRDGGERGQGDDRAVHRQPGTGRAERQLSDYGVSSLALRLRLSAQLQGASASTPTFSRGGLRLQPSNPSPLGEGRLVIFLLMCSKELDFVDKYSLYSLYSFLFFSFFNKKST